MEVTINKAINYNENLRLHQKSKMSKFVFLKPIKNYEQSKIKLSDSPLKRINNLDKVTLHSLEVKCQGIKLNTRNFHTLEKRSKRHSVPISNTDNLFKPNLLKLYYTNSLRESYIFMKDNLICQKKVSQKSINTTYQSFLKIPSQHILIRKQQKFHQNKLTHGYHTMLNRYVSFYHYDEVNLPQNVKNILPALGIFCYNDVKYYVTDMHEENTLQNLVNQFGKLDQETVRIFVRQVAQAVHQLHMLGLSHNRLNLDTILHDRQGNLLVNFFRSSKKPVEQQELATFLYYLSPELIETGIPHAKNDIWAIGSIVIQLLTFKPFKYSPLHIYNRLDKQEKILSKHLVQKIQTVIFSIPDGNFYSKFDASIELLDFINYCITPERQTRPSAEELLAHPFLKIQRL